MHHNTLKLLVLTIMTGLFAGSCNEKLKIEEIVADFDLSEMPAQIEKGLASLKSDTFHTHYFDTLSVYYSKNNFKPLWMNELQDSMFRDAILKLSDSCVYEGFKREHYQSEKLIALLSKAKKQKLPELYQTLALADLYLSNFMVALWHDKVLGRTDPREVLGMKYTLPFPSHPEFRLLDVLDKDSGLIKLRQYRPVHSDFGKLKKLLMDAYGATGGRETMIDTAGIRKLKPGDSTWIADQIANRLVELGLAPDSIIPMYAHEIIYTRHLSEFVKAFQRSSNLSDDGIIGKSTLKILNASRNDKIDEIRANIERIRWFGTEPAKPYVMVNVPEFMLYMFWADSVKSMSVCVGQGKERYYDQKLKKYVVSKSYIDKPMNHETPQIYSNIDYVILNPTWTVPSSIVGREMFAHILRDPGYLNRNNYQVLKNGEVVSPYSINWRKLKPGNIPYKIRQNAGDDNSLGKIKFTFKNPFDVYLHDTPLKSKFKLNNRAVSHGCVRVQGPVDLTGFVLQQNTRVTYEDVLIMMGMPPSDTARARQWREDSTSYKKVVKKTHPVRVEQKMTVFFDYKTIVFDAAGAPRFIFDVYDKNRQIVEAMNRP